MDPQQILTTVEQYLVLSSVGNIVRYYTDARSGQAMTRLGDLPNLVLVCVLIPKLEFQFNSSRPLP